MTGVMQEAPETANRRFFVSMRNSVGAGQIKGARERWIAPAALYTASNAVRYNGTIHDFVLPNALGHVPSTESAIQLASGGIRNHIGQ
jgi:hypothetical protein